MQKRFQRTHAVFHFIGQLMLIVSLLLLLPLVAHIFYWNMHGDGWNTILAFIIPALATCAFGLLLKCLFKPSSVGITGAMLICGLSWIFISAVGALPYVLGIGSGYLDAFFEAMSGFPTTGITVYSGLDAMPRSILLWRSLTQWLGGTGILSLYIIIMFGGGGIHHILGAESHKIASKRPAPGLYHTLKIVWGIYGGLTLFAAIVLFLEGMTLFDAVCHAMTALSTGGFSPYDASIAQYRMTGHHNFQLLEYTLSFLMMLGGINFLVHFRVLKGDFKALWDNAEIRLWWRLILTFIILIMADHIIRHNPFQNTVGHLAGLEQLFRTTLFQVIALLTTTGFGTEDITSNYFPALSKQLFLVMMFIGGCVGSTGGGFKVLRISILSRLFSRELFKLRVPARASKDLILDQKKIPEEEILRVSALFFGWTVLILIGGLITALLTRHNALASISGMFSAVGNIGPCYISVQDMIVIHPIVKLTYIFGMLAGRLEILPVMLLFSRKAWR